jgi:hypothetical protein
MQVVEEVERGADMDCLEAATVLVAVATHSKEVATEKGAPLDSVPPRQVRVKPFKIYRPT